MDHLRSGVRDQPDQHGETPSLINTQKVSQAWWCMPLAQAIQEAEAGQLLALRSSEPRSSHWATE